MGSENCGSCILISIVHIKRMNIIFHLEEEKKVLLEAQRVSAGDGNDSENERL